MNQSELVSAMAAKTGECRASQERSLEAMLEAVTDALASGDDLSPAARAGKLTRY